ncbi:MAG TPA: CHAT domain-containing protein, partial [Actinotalea sp.]|nr:CHAT domain-containing protein [Actinotalea sp.]
MALRRAGGLTGREPLTLALAVHAVGATLAFGTGRPAIGRRRVAAGQQLLAAHRRQLGSVEAVTAAAVHGERLALIEVGAALRRGDPLAVLGAVERGRATFAGPARVRPPDDPRLAELLADLRRALERERAAQDAAGRAAAARVVDGLLAAARQRSWQAGGEAGGPPAPEPAGLVEELAGSDRTVVDLVAVDGVVHAVVVDGSGARLHHLADLAEVRRTGRRVAADLQALSGSHLPRELRGVVRGSLETGLARLDELLLAPLGVTGSAHLVAGGTLVTVPWGLFPSRRGLATSVATRLEDRVSVGRRPGVLAVAGPGVPHAAAEVAAVTAAWGGGRSLLGAAATGRVTAAGLGEAGVVHLAAHGHHEPDNPLFSWVGLTDGPLFAHELEGTDLAGSLVVLSACELGQATVRPGGEALGMASVLLRLGADSVIAALASLRDDVAAR